MLQPNTDPSPANAGLPESDALCKRHSASEDIQRERRVLLQHAKAHFSRARNLDASLRRITEIAVRCAEITRVSIWLQSSDGKRLHCVQVFDTRVPNEKAGKQLKIDESSTSLQILSREPAISAGDIEQLPAALRPLSEGNRSPQKVRAAIHAGIRSSGKLIGVLCLEDAQIRNWTADEEQFAVSLAEVAALAIKEDQLRRTEKVRRSFAELGRKLNACTTPRMAAHVIGRTAQQLWGWDALFLHLYDQATDRLLPVLGIDTIDGRKTAVDIGSVDGIAKSRELLGVKKLLLNSRPKNVRLIPFGDVKRVSRSRMFITIRKKDRIFAILSIQSYSANAYAQDALDGLEALGEYCTGAVARLQAEALRRESEERFRCLSDATTEGILIHNGTTIFETNPQVNRIFGYSDEELRSKSLSDLLPNGCGKIVSSRDPRATEATGIRSDGRVFPLESVTRTCRYLGAPAKVTVVRDISERKRIERQLRDHSRKILEAQEAERQRVSRDLHDSVNQLLTAARYTLETATHWVGQLPRVEKQLEKTRALLGKAMEEIRIISWNLRPNELDHAGLPVAIRTLCQDCQERSGIDIRFHLPEPAPNLSKNASVTLFRFVQEGLSNACRHSGATRIDVTARCTETALRLEIADDGIGFSPTDFRSDEERKNGLGLINMKERALSAGGEFELQSAPGKGVRLRLTLPLSETAKTEADDQEATIPALKSRP